MCFYGKVLYRDCNHVFFNPKPKTFCTVQRDYLLFAEIEQKKRQDQKKQQQKSQDQQEIQQPPTPPRTPTPTESPNPVHEPCDLMRTHPLATTRHEGLCGTCKSKRQRTDAVAARCRSILAESESRLSKWRRYAAGGGGKVARRNKNYSRKEGGSNLASPSPSPTSSPTSPSFRTGGKAQGNNQGGIDPKNNNKISRRRRRTSVSGRGSTEPRGLETCVARDPTLETVDEDQEEEEYITGDDEDEDEKTAMHVEPCRNSSAAMAGFTETRRRKRQEQEAHEQQQAEKKDGAQDKENRKQRKRSGSVVSISAVGGDKTGAEWGTKIKGIDHVTATEEQEGEELDPVQEFLRKKAMEKDAAHMMLSVHCMQAWATSYRRASGGEAGGK